jgi:COP9 signalosome complex subunit 5
VSAVALIKITVQAQSGGNLEVMGLLQGKVKGLEFIIMGSFALPVECTETRVNALASANEHMVSYGTYAEQVGRLEGVCGWYHRYPGYCCLMSGIDINTHLYHQMVEDPYPGLCAHYLLLKGRNWLLPSLSWELQCSRPKHFAYQHITLSKIEDFGIYHKRSYRVEHSFFKSALYEFSSEQLWHKYWVQTLSSSFIITNRDYITANIADVS